MKRIVLLALAILYTHIVFGQTKVYKGAWFRINYPSTFTAKSSLKSTSAGGYESARFISPDRLVEFYVFSPQWSGDPKDIALKPNEKLAETRSQTKESQISTWWKITAKDGSYSRSYYEKKDTLLNTKYVFGIKYSNQKAYMRYQKKYAAFKSSLIQYAD